MTRMLPALALGALLLLAFPTPSRAQFAEVQIDPALGNRPTFGPGGYLSNGFGYNANGPRGLGYYPGLYNPPFTNGSEPSPYYSPIWNSITTIPPIDPRYTGPGARAGWAISPSLPFTGTSHFHPLQGLRKRR
jgi:hypothetical protein